MKMMHRKKNSNESNASTKSQPSVMSGPAPKRPPRSLDLMEAALHNEKSTRQAQETARHHKEGYGEVGTGKENAVQDKPLSRPALSKMQNSYRQIAYDQYLSEAFGLDGQLKAAAPAAVQRLRVPQAAEQRPDSDISAMTADSMEVNFHMNPKDTSSAKERRPKIQVTIPGAEPKPTKRPTSSAHLIHQMSRSKTSARSHKQVSHLEISPPSATRSNEAPARMSIVSPLSAVQMPKPRRPFSAWSLEEMTNDMPVEAPLRSAPLPSTREKSASTDSSEDSAGDHDDRSSVYSGHSSMSSLDELSPEQKWKIQRKHSIAFSIMSPAAAGVFDGMPLTTHYAAKLRGHKSTTSLTVDMNKPLPPEPGMADISPLNVTGYSRSGSMNGRRKAPSPLTISRNSMTEGPSQFPSRMSSLRSKYTPADLDALDEAFTKTSPNVTGFYMHNEQSLSQAQLELEAHLGTINEEPSSQRNTVAVNDPLQISRGPNTMVPSRQAPPPPSSSSSIKLSDGSISARRRVLKKSNTSHVAMQMQTRHTRAVSDSGSDSEIRRRISMPVRSRSSMKAERVLGKPASPNSSAMERELSAESNWSSSPSSRSANHSYDDSSSPTMSREDSSTPETDVSSDFHTDHAFEEVKARLELLSPKNDQHYFSNWAPRQESSDSDASVRLPLQEQSNNSTRPTTSDEDVGPSNEVISPEIQVTPVEEKQEPEVEVPLNVEDESDVHPLQRRARQEQAEDPPRSLASIALSEIPDMYASLPSPALTMTTERPQSMSAEEVERMISADAAEQVLLRILQNLDNLQDLFATATVSRGFYRTFKRHELPLMKNALYGMSPAAWELREMSPPYPGLEGTSPKLDYSPSLYLQHYMRDMYIMIALKSVILIHCESFLRADTITALAGGETERATQIDDAFWRIWTFCQVFGCGSNREDDIMGQMDWLRGGQLARQQRKNRNATDLGNGVDSNSVLYSSPPSFGKGNAGGLSAEDLYDMTEIWTCLGVLVRGFHGKRQEAREYGIFQNADIITGDVEQEDSVLGMDPPPLD
ncbi:hypothetical protein P7C71_g2238, partial [Lecanoromycetidae sp. Uapishka_2]